LIFNRLIFNPDEIISYEEMHAAQRTVHSSHRIRGEHGFAHLRNSPI